MTFVILIIVLLSFNEEIHINKYNNRLDIQQDGVLVERYSTGSSDLYKLN